jgi:hypothetical protein
MESQQQRKSFRTLVVSDIHNKISVAQRVIDSVPHDKCILLGDYFDSCGDTPYEAKKTAIWLKECVLHNPKIVALMGNHCTSYVFNNNAHFVCSGYSPDKDTAINSVLNEEDKSKFGVYHIDQGYVLSHAGLTNALWKEFSSKFTEQGIDETKIQFFDRVMKVVTNEAVEAAKSNNDTMLFAAGWDRGGRQKNGGMTWVDWETLSPIKGINQIVGHSTHQVPQVMIQKVGGGLNKKDISEYYITDFDKNKTYLSLSYGLDTSLRHYALIEDGNIDIFHIETNMNLKYVKDIYLPYSPMGEL